MPKKKNEIILNDRTVIRTDEELEEKYRQAKNKVLEEKRNLEKKKGGKRRRKIVEKIYIKGDEAKGDFVMTLKDFKNKKKMRRILNFLDKNGFVSLRGKGRQDTTSIKRNKTKVK